MIELDGQRKREYTKKTATHRVTALIKAARTDSFADFIKANSDRYVTFLSS